MSVLLLLRGTSRLRPFIGDSFQRRSLFTSISSSCSAAVPNVGWKSNRWRCVAPQLSRENGRDNHLDLSGFKSSLRFQSSQQDELSLLIDKTSTIQLDKIYASPVQALHAFARDSVEYELDSIAINENGREDRWYTAGLYLGNKKRKNKVFCESGTFGELMKVLCPDDDLFYKIRRVDGKVYYTTEQHAKEAAAARCIDGFAEKQGIVDTSDLEPIRYCLETPYSLWDDQFQNKLHWIILPSPQYFFRLRMERMFGWFEDVTYQMLSEKYIYTDGVQEWYSATCIHPVTGEGFDSGVFAVNGSMSFRQCPCPPSSPPVLEEIKILDNRVYYKDPDMAKHAAAARALDNLNFRDGIGTEGIIANISRMCFEEPYLIDSERNHSIQYDKIERVVESRRRDPVNELLYGSIIRMLMVQDRTTVLNLFVKACESVTGRKQGYATETYLDYIYSAGKTFASASLKVKSTGEEFHSGLFGDMNNQANVKISDGRVYYSSASHATQAAAAKAIDCILYRGDMHRAQNLSWAKPTFQFCADDPYLDAEERDRQHVNYMELMRTNTAAAKEYELPLGAGQKSISEAVAERFATASYALHVPLNFLDAALRGCAHYRMSMLMNNEIRSDEKSKWHTSTFIDPLTGEEFHSGLVGQEVNVEKKASNLMRVPLHHADAKIANGRVYYRTAKIAEHAAAARAIDCYIYRRATNITSGDNDALSKIRICLEDPYMSSAERDAQHVDYNELSKQRPSARTLVDNDAGVFNAALLERFATAPYTLHVPLNFLINLFQKSNLASGKGFVMNEKLYENDGLETWHTSTFIDPLTGEEFHSGLVGQEVNVEKKASNTLREPLHQADAKIANGRVYYRTAKIADHAAAARAIDCYNYRRATNTTSGDNDALSKIRICLEDPYMSSAERDAQHVDYNELSRQRPSAKTFVDKNARVNKENAHNLISKYTEIWRHRLAGVDEPVIANQDSTDTFDLGLSLSASVDEIAMIDQGNEQKIDHAVCVTDESVDSSDDGIFQIVSNSHEGNNKLSTMGRIAEIWSQQPDQSSAEELQSVHVRLQNILAWYNRANKSPRTYDDAVALSELCEKVLRVLAESGRANDDSVEVDIAEEGGRIWDKLCELQSGFGASSIDTDTCNSYIKCLDSSDSTSASVAEDLLMRMSSEKEYGRHNVVLPSPNVDTYNAVMRLWSETNGLNKDSVNRVYALLEDASDVYPNNDTFKILIAINSKRDDGTFSFHDAERCLRKMSESCPTLRPTLEVFNAALSKRRVANDEYKPSWLWNGRAFDGGFLDAKQSSDLEALDVEQWCVFMERNGIIGDIETFEAGIQAWVDTGTVDGLLKAEGWMKRVLVMTASGSNQNITPRHQTFQPIIAAWALCGSARSLPRVTEWINQLSILSTSLTMPSLAPDVNTFASKIIAIRRYQASVAKQYFLPKALESSAYQQEVVRSDTELAFDLAKRCHNLLVDELLSGQTNFAGLLDADSCAPIFVNCIEAWGDAARLAQQVSINDLPNSGIRELVNVSRLYETKLRKAIASDVTEPKATRHHIKCLHEIYSAVVRQLIQMDSDTNKISRDGQSRSIVGEKIADMERMLRSYEHNSRLTAGISDGKMKKQRLEFYQEILRGCKGVTATSDYGHVVRICSAVMDFLAHGNERRTDEFIDGGHDITHLFNEIVAVLTSQSCTMTHPRERKLMLTKVYDKASQFFDRSERNKFGAVDKASLIGTIRLALVDLEDVESFMTSLEERHSNRRRAR